MNQSIVHVLFTETDLERIERAVASAEVATSGEIATMVVPASDSYREAEALGAVLLSGLISLVVAVVTGHVTIWSYIPLIFLLFLPCRFMLQRYPALKLPFVGKGRIAEAVKERAIRAFYEKKLYKTVNESGILIFLSLLEHKVWILGDRGINEKIPHDEWEELAHEMSAGMKEGKACDALCAVIGKCGVILAHHFPKMQDDVNELSDRLIM